MRDVGIEEWVKEKEENIGIWRPGIGHGRATTGTGRAKLLVFWVFGKAWDGTAVRSFWHFGAQKIFFRVLESVSDNYLQNNLKQTKND